MKRNREDDSDELEVFEDGFIRVNKDPKVWSGLSGGHLQSYVGTVRVSGGT